MNISQVLIVCVNYNSYPELKQYLSSIDKAASLCENTKVKVEIVDNSECIEKVETIEYTNISVNIKNLGNIGYFPGAQHVINGIDNILDYDYVVISNVDIQMDENFFMQLAKLQKDKDLAWIAPKIYSRNEERDRNPKVITRYSKKKLFLLYFMYRFPILFYLYTNTAYKRKKFQHTSDRREIYAGHGSFIILSKYFFENHRKLNYPIFLFGEELYLAEEILNIGKKVQYEPSLVIYDNEHVSTSKMKSHRYFKYNKESIRYILNKYYNE